MFLAWSPSLLNISLSWCAQHVISHVNIYRYISNNTMTPYPLNRSQFDSTFSPICFCDLFCTNLYGYFLVLFIIFHSYTKIGVG